jgi:hypothetical protein
MKKKNFEKKLVLKKETVALLDNDQLNNVKGGYITATCPDFGCGTYRCTIGCPTEAYPNLCD